MIPPLCFITDANAVLPIPDQAEQVARGGAGWVQLRHKTLDDAGFAELARAVLVRLVPLGVRLMINDRVEVACAMSGVGLHVGQSDGDPALIRDRIGPDTVLGLSIETLAQVSSIPPECIDYLGVGPVRATASKADHAAPLGFDGLAAVTAKTGLPCMAIGGLQVADTTAVRRAGCTGVAVVSAISRADDPQQAARAFMDEWSNV